MSNPLLSDRDVSFHLYEVLDAESLLSLAHFADHSLETFDAYIGVCRRFAREAVFPAFRAVDEDPPKLVDGRVTVHERLHGIYKKMRELGVFAASRSFEVGGQQLPLTIATAAHLYIMAANPAVYSFAGLSTGAAHLIEEFGNDDLKARYMTPLYEGLFTGTMALTEPHAGSSLADVATRATPSGDHVLLSGAKIFISGGDHDLTENIVHLVLARLDGAPAGIKGVSLFVVPKFRVTQSGLEPNDVRVSGLVHKIGWRCLPAVLLALGEAGDCHGWLVGEAHQGIPHMFQMMNEARISVGADAVASASAAYHESLAYAMERPQGRPLTSKDPRLPQVPIIEHADVRRMLLREKAIVEGGLGLILQAALFSDRARHASTEPERQHAQILLDLLTPVAKSFPAEKGFESNALALQIHGGYGYTSEFLPEAWLRDQKLNSIHEGITGIQGLDLLGRKVMASGGAALAALQKEVSSACRRAESAGVEASLVSAVQGAGTSIAALTKELGVRGRTGDVEGMLRHSADFLELFSTYVVSWQWLLQAAATRPESCFETSRPSGGAELSSRGIAWLLIAALLVAGCSSTRKTERKAFLAAGLALQREAPEPSFEDLRTELDLFLNDELQDLKDRTKRQEEHELGLYRKVYVLGSAAAVLAFTSGTLNNPDNRGVQYALGGVSTAVALTGFGVYLVRTGQMKDCREFLDRGGQELSEWGRFHLVPSGAKVPRELWLDYVNRVAAIRAHESCLRIR